MTANKASERTAGRGASSLDRALVCDTETLVWENGAPMTFYVDRGHTGRPLLLIHSINAAPSAMEIKPLFDYFRTSRPCYAPDLPGFGLSARDPINYTVELFSHAIAELINSVTDEHGLSPDIVTLSLSSEFAVRAIVERHAPCHSLTCISPTGLGRRPPPGPDVGKKINALTATPLLGASLYRLLTTAVSVRYFLNKAFTAEVPKELVDYAVRTTRQPGARFAPFAFLSMQLFSADALKNLYGALTSPTLILYDQDPNIDFDRLPELLKGNPRVHAERITPSRGLPHWELPEQTVNALMRFWTSIAEAE